MGSSDRWNGLVILRAIASRTGARLRLFVMFVQAAVRCEEGLAQFLGGRSRLRQ